MKPSGQRASSLPPLSTRLGLLVGAVLVSWAPIEGLRLYGQVRDAEAASLLSPPLPLFDGPALALGLSLVVASLVALGRGRTESPAYRLLPMAGAVVVFCKLFVLPDVAIPPFLPAPDRMVEVAIRAVAAHGRALAADGEGALPVQPEAWTPALIGLGRPLFLHRGEPVTAYALRVFEGCDGPRLDRGDEAPGTVFVCLAPDRRHGWITGVGLPVLAGAPRLLSQAGGEPWTEETGSSPPPAGEYDEAQVGDRAAPLPAP